jgi:hypothetical protein
MHRPRRMRFAGRMARRDRLQGCRSVMVLIWTGISTGSVSNGGSRGRTRRSGDSNPDGRKARADHRDRHDVAQESSQLWQRPIHRSVQPASPDPDWLVRRRLSVCRPICRCIGSHSRIPNLAN